MLIYNALISLALYEPFLFYFATPFDHVLNFFTVKSVFASIAPLVFVVSVTMPGRPTADLEEQRAVLRGQFLHRLTTQAYDYLCKAYGSAAMSKSHAKSTFKAYKDARTEFRSQTGNHSTPRGSPKQRTEENIAMFCLIFPSRAGVDAVTHLISTII